MAAGGRREANKARTRDAIMVAAIELMDRQGFRTTTMAQIAAAAGVSPATVFNYFPTKASILFDDDHMWRPPELEGAAATPQETALRLLAGMLDAPGWSRSVDDPLARTRFRLVQQEPELREQQVLQAMLQVPVFAGALHALHPDVSESALLVFSGSVVGALVSAVTFAPAGDVRQSLLDAARAAASGFRF